MFSISFGICRQWPHLHHSGIGAVCCLGLSGDGGGSGSGSTSGLTVRGCEGECGSTSRVTELLFPGGRTVRGLSGDPCLLIMGPESSSPSGINWLWMNSRLPTPLESTLMASRRTVSSSKFKIRFFKLKITVELDLHFVNLLTLQYFLFSHTCNLRDHSFLWVGWVVVVVSGGHPKFFELKGEHPNN